MAMNVYRNSGQNSGQPSYPTDATFNSIDTSALRINGAAKGDVLITDALGNVEGVQLGPQGYALVSNINGNGLPAYSNSLTMNSVTATSFTIPGTVNGDLLVMNSSQTAARLPIGPDGAFLVSNGTVPSWRLQDYAYISVGAGNFTGFTNTTVTNFSIYTSPYFNNFSTQPLKTTYTGNGGVFSISANLSLVADQDNSLWKFYIWLNGQELPASASYFQLKANDYCNMTTQAIIPLVTNDVIQATLTRVDTGAAANVTTYPFGILISRVD